jgi:integrase
MAGSKRERPKGSGRWELRVYLGVENGKKRWASRVHRGDAKSAELELARMTVRAADGEYSAPPAPDPDDPTLREWLEDWYARESPEWSPTSASTARSHIDNHITPGLGDRRLTEIRLRDVELWLRSLRDKGLKPSTQLRVFGVLRSSLDQAERWELIDRNPAARADLPEVRYEEPNWPGVDDLLTALRLAANEHERTLIWLAAATGGRRGQLVALRWSDFDLDEQLLTFHRGVIKVDGGTQIKAPKAGKPITLPIDELTVDVVKRYRRHRQEFALSAGVGRLKPSSYLFARDPSGIECWYPDRATKIWDRIRNARAEPADGREQGELLAPGLQGTRLHDLRHAHASLLIMDGAPRRTVGDRLGHSQLATLDRYSHGVDEVARAAARRIGELLAGGAAAWPTEGSGT